MLVLAYHTIEAGTDRLTVPAAALRRQVVALLDEGYEAVTFGRAVTQPTGKLLAVTFDDGGRSIVEHARPVLDELGAPGTVFAAVGGIGTPGMVTWEELAELAASGWEVGSHTVTHPRLPDLDDDSLERELRDSRLAIEARLDLPCRSIAYPFGAVDRRTRDAAERAGYEVGCTTSGELASADPLCWPRVGVSRHDGPILFRAKVSVAGRRLRGLPIRPGLDGAGRLARSVGSRRRQPTRVRQM